LQHALDREVEFDTDHFLEELQDALAYADADLPPKRVARAMVLLTIARVRNVTETRGLLAPQLHREALSDNVRYEIARVLARLSARPEETLSLLRSTSDPVVAGAIDEAGDTKDGLIRHELRGLVAQREKYQATRTGDALARLHLLNDYKTFWAGRTDAGQRLDFLIQRAGEMYLPVPPASPPVRDDGLVASWLRQRLEELHCEDPELVIRRISANLETAPANAKYLRVALEDLQKKR
jgi:hypothetical protein